MPVSNVVARRPLAVGLILLVLLPLLALPGEADPLPTPVAAPPAEAYTADYQPPTGRASGAPYGIHLSFAEDPRTTLTVTWFTAGAAAATQSRVQWGADIDSLVSFEAATTTKAYNGAGDPDDSFPLVDIDVHAATIRGLAPGQTIAYRVLGSTGASFVYEAHTAPLADTPVQVTTYGDHGVQRASKGTAAHILRNLPDLIVILGDISYANGNQATWDLYFDLYEPLYARVPVMPSTGNHEADDGTYMDGFRSRFTLPGVETMYGFDYANLHFTIVDGTTDTLENHADTVATLLTQDLMSASVRRAMGEIDFTFAAQHFPIFSNHDDRNQDAALAQAAGMGALTHVDNFALLAVEEPVFQAAQLDVLLTGHNHHFERSRPLTMGRSSDLETHHYLDPAGYIQVISGGGGQSLYDFAPPSATAEWSVEYAKSYHVTEMRASRGVLDVRSVVTSSCAPQPNCDPTPPGELLDAWAIQRVAAPAMPHTAAPGREHEGPVRFVLTGDTGEGNSMQYAVSSTIEKVCETESDPLYRGCDFAAILGDIVYENGIDGPYDPEMDEKFELPYANLEIPIFGVLGNHDNSADPASAAFGQELGSGHWYDAGRHFVAYHYRPDRLSEKFQMPDRYYGFRYGDAEFFALDSNTMMFNGVPTGTADPQAFLDAAEQGPWLDRALAASDATWKFTLAHHPYVSNGEHGDAGHYDDENTVVAGEQAAPGVDGTGVKRFFEEHVCASNQVDVHFSGHDHDLQWLKPVDGCGATQFIVSGAGAKTRALEHDPGFPAAPDADAFFGKGSTPGFFWVEVDGSQMRVTVYRHDGVVLFERFVTKQSLASEAADPARAVFGLPDGFVARILPQNAQTLQGTTLIETDLRNNYVFTVEALSGDGAAHAFRDWRMEFWSADPAVSGEPALLHAAIGSFGPSGTQHATANNGDNTLTVSMPASKVRSSNNQGPVFVSFWVPGTPGQLVAAYGEATNTQLSQGLIAAADAGDAPQATPVVLKPRRSSPVAPGTLPDPV